MNDVILNKLETIRSCLDRIEQLYGGDPSNLSDITLQDAIVLNLQRACESCISLAMHVVSKRDLGVPQNSREAFTKLEEAGFLTEDLTLRLKAMVGFRNIAIHAYQEISLEILRAILENNLDDFRAFSDQIIAHFGQP
jgi:uncharacterized protein YutE (UPF0331/DUF86 family)